MEYWFGVDRLKWCGHLMVKKFENVYSFRHNTWTWQTRRWTDRHHTTA